MKIKFFLTLLALFVFAGLSYAQNTTVYKSQGGNTMTIASGGTLAVATGATFTNGGVAVPVLRVAQDAIASGQTAKTVTVTGATAASKCVASANEVPTNAVYVKSVVAGTNQAVVTASADPGASNLDLTVICAD